MSTASLAATAYQQIKLELDTFHYAPGDRFSENEVSGRLGMSRTPVREALVRLQREGYISVLPKLGWVVNAIDFEVFAQLYDVRAVLECAAADLLCACTDTAERLQALTAIWCVPDAERLREHARVSLLDEAFHLDLVQAAGNLEMARIHRDLTDRIRVVRRLEFTREDRIGTTYAEHARILQALLARDAAQARTLLQTHIAVSRDEVQKITVHALQAARRQRLSQAHVA
ncbi:GntR family transcriptional regulator [Comamonas serinivorans]|uniref:GntR family transcriptional regulator n=1 Tax=Comamonas serinivorans TaxID=1082851 RepID=A0A1Y0EMI4_9BURK|nr:GntR family transcriptional regulator [Comamonas serinivorans]ARU04843.1 GntR family transcriptional regulator [Comamonas serinivorans]